MGRSGRLYPQPLGQLEAEGDAGCHLWEEFQAGAEGAHIWPRMLPLKFPGRGGAGGYSPDREKSEAQREAGTPPPGGHAAWQGRNATQGSLPPWEGVGHPLRRRPNPGCSRALSSSD